MPLTQVWRIIYQKLLNFLLVTKSGCASSSNHCLEHQSNSGVITSYLKWKCNISRLFLPVKTELTVQSDCRRGTSVEKSVSFEDFFPNPIKRLVRNPVKKIQRKKSHMSSFNSAFFCSVCGKPWNCCLSRTWISSSSHVPLLCPGQLKSVHHTQARKNLHLHEQRKGI